MKSVFVRFVREDAGQDLIEYALLAGLIAVASVAAMQTLGGEIGTLFGKVEGELEGVVIP